MSKRNYSSGLKQLAQCSFRDYSMFKRLGVIHKKRATVIQWAYAPISEHMLTFVFIKLVNPWAYTRVSIYSRVCTQSGFLARLVLSLAHPGSPWLTLDSSDLEHMLKIIIGIHKRVFAEHMLEYMLSTWSWTLHVLIECTHVMSCPSCTAKHG